ncbi:hypothetical protein A0H81_03168 [Grifola frondosa]|uniref:Uncharacterized protein n=1 Tax=Grifola frondosa TaxID=5627 RepID=A0A1C7MHZ6_GRIFR|nr:hypothetical protein A0H81_03168 [Grifola frondosa]
MYSLTLFSLVPVAARAVYLPETIQSTSVDCGSKSSLTDLDSIESSVTSENSHVSISNPSEDGLLSGAFLVLDKYNSDCSTIDATDEALLPSTCLPILGRKAWGNGDCSRRLAGRRLRSSRPPSSAAHWPSSPSKTALPPVPSPSHSQNLGPIAIPHGSSGSQSQTYIIIEDPRDALQRAQFAVIGLLCGVILILIVVIVLYAQHLRTIQRHEKAVKHAEEGGDSIEAESKS